MTIKIHGKDYTPVSDRVKQAQEAEKKLSITTEVLYTEPVVIKATVVTDKGTFTGISAANPSKSIEASNPYEVAETSAVGRALGFAGYGIETSIASADEMIKAGQNESKPTNPATPKIVYASDKQVGMIAGLLKQKGQSDEDLKAKYSVTSKKLLSIATASQIIENLLKLPDVEMIPERQIEDMSDYS